MRGLVLVVAGALALMFAATLGPAAFAGDRPASGSDRPITGRDLRGVNFLESCRFSHRAPDDPIVFFGKPGASHDHTFVGNRTTNARSTFGSLRSGTTSCTRADDTAAYWMPTLYEGTTPVLPAAATIYYPRDVLGRPHLPEQPAHDRRQRERDGAAALPHRVLELRRRRGRLPVQHRPDVCECARVGTPPPRALPELLGRQAARQPRPQEPHGVRDAGALPVQPPRRRARDHRAVSLSEPGGKRLLARIRGTTERARRLSERLEATGAQTARQGLPQRARPLWARLSAARPLARRRR